MPDDPSFRRVLRIWLLDQFQFVIKTLLALGVIVLGVAITWLVLDFYRYLIGNLPIPVEATAGKAALGLFLTIVVFVRVLRTWDDAKRKARD